MTMKLFSINYLNPNLAPQPEGGIVQQYVVGRDCILDDWGDFRPHDEMQYKLDGITHIGFHGYRKHMVLLGGVDIGWHTSSLSDFRFYQRQLVHDPRIKERIETQFTTNDIIVVPPYTIPDNMIGPDFGVSRSKQDWEVVERVLGSDVNLNTNKIYNFFYMTRVETYKRLMEWWGPRMKDISEKLGPFNSGDNIYKNRRVAFIAERVFSLWLEKHWADLNPLVVPLVQCWEAH